MATTIDNPTPETSPSGAPARGKNKKTQRAERRAKSAQALKKHSEKRVTGEEKRSRMSAGIDWPIAIWIGVIHLGVLAAPFTFTWQGLALFSVLYWITGSIGICMTFHRLLTHRSFKTSSRMRYFLAWVGQMAGEGSAVHWVANHRKHHAHSDQEGDPHSPHDGAWWSHMIWFMWARDSEDYAAHNKRWAPDLANDRGLLFLDKTFILWHVLLTAVLFGIGYAASGTYMAWSLVVWGMFLRLFVVLHVTWLVNSASHMWGYRTYQTTDDSRNNWVVALLTFGEGWHNNHHAYPSMARAGHKWWEIDTTFWVIKGLEKVGLVSDIVDGHHEKQSVAPE